MSISIYMMHSVYLWVKALTAKRREGLGQVDGEGVRVVPQKLGDALERIGGRGAHEAEHLRIRVVARPLVEAHEQKHEAIHAGHGVVEGTALEVLHPGFIA